jgi:hypothetical protein
MRSQLFLVGDAMELRLVLTESLAQICESGISAHGAHISGAMSVSTQLMLSDRLTNEHKRTIFFLGNLAW